MNLLEKISATKRRALQKKCPDRAVLISFLEIKNPEAIEALFEAAAEVKDKFSGDRVSFCSIVNAKSGNCSEDCGFCTQSVHSTSDIDTYPLLSSEKMVSASKDAAANGATRFGVVIGSKGIAYLSKEDQEKIYKAIQKIRTAGHVIPDASLGLLNRECARRLKEAGLEGYHHNLESSERFYPKICSTHSYRERIETIQIAKEAGFYTCSGGILGMGEELEDRIDLALTLRSLGVKSVPINFLNPLPGTPLENREPIPAIEALLAIAVFRLILPDCDIRICGGREKTLKKDIEKIYRCGANATMVGNYLTSLGRNPKEDHALVQKEGLKLEGQESVKKVLEESFKEEKDKVCI